MKFSDPKKWAENLEKRMHDIQVKQLVESAEKHASERGNILDVEMNELAPKVLMDARRELQRKGWKIENVTAKGFRMTKSQVG